jgi:hypothetical protein
VDFGEPVVFTAERTSWSVNTLHEQMITSRVLGRSLSGFLLLIWQARGFDAKQKSKPVTVQACKNFSDFSVFRLSMRLQKLQFL